MKMAWYSAYLLSLFLEPMVKKRTCMQTTSVTAMVIFFRKWHSEGYLIKAMFRVPSQQLQSTLTTAF